MRVKPLGTRRRNSEREPSCMEAAFGDTPSQRRALLKPRERRSTVQAARAGKVVKGTGGRGKRHIDSSKETTAQKITPSEEVTQAKRDKSRQCTFDQRRKGPRKKTETDGLLILLTRSARKSYKAKTIEREEEQLDETSWGGGPRVGTKGVSAGLFRPEIVLGVEETTLALCKRTSFARTQGGGRKVFWWVGVFLGFGVGGVIFGGGWGGWGGFFLESGGVSFFWVFLGGGLWRVQVWWVLGGVGGFDWGRRRVSFFGCFGGLGWGGGGGGVVLCGEARARGQTRGPGAKVTRARRSRKPKNDKATRSRDKPRGVKRVRGAT